MPFAQSNSFQAVYAAQPVAQASSSKPATNRPIKDKWALVIGISKFADGKIDLRYPCLLYTSDAADERSSVDLGGRRIIKKKKKENNNERMVTSRKKQKKQSHQILTM